MSKKSEKEKTKAAVLEKAAQNLPAAPAPGQLPAPDAQGVWNPPPLRPMAKVEEPVRVGPKVDWNGEPRDAGVGPEPMLTTETIKPEPEVTNAVTPMQVAIPSEVFKQGLETLAKTETKPLTKASRKPRAPKPEKPVRKSRNPGVYEVFMYGKVQGSVSVGQSGILEIMIPQAGVYNTREDAEFAAKAVATGNPGKIVEVHRRLSRMTFEATTTTKLVRN